MANLPLFPSLLPTSDTVFLPLLIPLRRLNDEVWFPKPPLLDDAKLLAQEQQFDQMVFVPSVFWVSNLEQLSSVRNFQSEAETIETHSADTEAEDEEMEDEESGEEDDDDEFGTRSNDNWL